MGPRRGIPAPGPAARSVRLVLAVLATFAASLAPPSAAGALAHQGAPPQAVAAGAWADQSVQFRAGDMTVYGTYRHPTHGAHRVPAVLLIAGSGPTDRNGNSPEISGPVDTLETLADWLSADGVASLRYDKLGSGQTGVGSYVDDPAAIGTGVYEQESAAALRFLAQQSQVDDAHLAVFGHSEGALFALLLATGAAGPVPKIHALGLIEPLSLRYLTLIAQQVDAQVTAQQGAGQISATVAAAVRAKLTAAVAQLRSKGTVAAGLPYGLANLLSPATAKFLSEADRDDPGVLASHLHTGTPVLVTCSDADVQVTCAEVAHVLTGLHHGGAAVDFVRLHGVDHVLKVDDSMGSAEYGSALAFSPQLHTALAAFVQQHLP